MGFWQIRHRPLWCVALWWWGFLPGQFALWCLHVCPVVQKEKGQWRFLSDLLLGLPGKVSGDSRLQQVGEGVVRVTLYSPYRPPSLELKAIPLFQKEGDNVLSRAQYLQILGDLCIGDLYLLIFSGILRWSQKQINNV